MVKGLPTMRETPVWSLGREDPLEKEMAKESQMLDLLCKIFKSAILNMFKELMETMSKEESACLTKWIMNYE